MGLQLVLQHVTLLQQALLSATFFLLIAGVGGFAADVIPAGG